MMTPSTASCRVFSWSESASVYAVACFGFALYALGAGQDANWDLQNYHLYNAYAFLNQRYSIDVAPASFQTYLNPLPYIPVYLLRALLPPPLAAVGQAMLQATIAPCAWAVCGMMPGLGRDARVPRGIATAVACTSATGLSEVGTSFADLALASLILAGLCAQLQADAATNKRNAWFSAAAGALVGMATGLKLTNGIYAVGLAASALLPLRSSLAYLRTLACITGGFGAGFLLTGGYWAIYLWNCFANPIFPGMNTVFRSQSAATVNFTDLRFLPATVIDGLSYPFRIAYGDHPSAENPFSDPRLAIALTLLVGSVIVTVLRRMASLQSSATRTLHGARAATFLWASFIAWLQVFAIQRYAVALDALAGILLVDRIASLTSRRLQRTACCLVAVLVLAATRPEDWWHRPWKDAFNPSLPAALADPAAFLAVSVPTGYWATLLPVASPFYNIASADIPTGGVLRQRLVQGLQDAPSRNVWLLGSDVPMSRTVRGRLAATGFVPAPPCIRAPSLWSVDTVFCRALPSGTRDLAAATFDAQRTVEFTSSGNGWMYEVAGWTNAGSGGTATDGPRAELAMSLEQPFPLSILELRVRDLRDVEAVRVGVNGNTDVRWLLTEDHGEQFALVCLPNPAPDSGVIDLTFETVKGRALGFTLRSIRLRLAATTECR